MTSLSSLSEKANCIYWKLHSYIGRLESQQFDKADLDIVCEELKGFHQSILEVRRATELEPPRKKKIWEQRVKLLQRQYDEFYGQYMRCDQRYNLKQQSYESAKPPLNSNEETVIEGLMEEGDSLNRSRKMLTGYQEYASDIIDSLNRQGGILQKVSSKVREIVGNIGISDNLLRVAERRNMEDKLLVYGGMLFVTLLFYTMVYFDSSVPRYGLI